MSHVLALFLLSGTSLDEEALVHSGARCVPCERPTSMTYPRRGSWACSGDGKTYSPADVARVCESRDGGTP